MVVGTTPYEDTKEAYPLDKKTLRQTAFRSFFMHASQNSETGSSIGWTWAIAPALKKIHTDEKDYQTALGQNLEYNNVSHFFCTLVMGVSLSMEAQKCDPAEIRSVRTALGTGLRSLERTVVFGFVLPWVLSLLEAAAGQGSILAPVVYGLVLFVLNVILRFALINVGYKQGSRILERYSRRQEALKKACTLWGVFSIGALIAVIPSDLFVFSADAATQAGTLVISSLPICMGLLNLGVTLLLHHLLTRKNWSLGRCALLTVVLSAVLSLFVML